MGEMVKVKISNEAIEDVLKKCLVKSTSNLRAWMKTLKKVKQKRYYKIVAWRDVVSAGPKGKGVI